MRLISCCDPGRVARAGWRPFPRRTGCNHEVAALCGGCAIVLMHSRSKLPLNPQLDNMKKRPLVSKNGLKPQSGWSLCHCYIVLDAING